LEEPIREDRPPASTIAAETGIERMLGAAALVAAALVAAALGAAALVAAALVAAALVAAGLSDREIAGRLVVSEAAVKTHINHVFATTGARDRAQAVHYASTHGPAG
jgi:DNA-binding CsgD family transcriptional regulator